MLIRGLMNIDRKWKSREGSVRRHPCTVVDCRSGSVAAYQLDGRNQYPTISLLYLRTSVICFTPSSLSTHLRFVSRHTRSILTKHFRWLYHYRHYQSEHRERAFESCENYCRLKLHEILTGKKLREKSWNSPSRNPYILFRLGKYLTKCC